jgi:tellurite methyltransferase
MKNVDIAAVSPDVRACAKRASDADLARTLIGVLRGIVGFAGDSVGDWVALLECHHVQHVRHRPPWRSAPWVEDPAERERRIGTTMNCPLCDRCELPDGLTLLRTTPVWDDRTMPEALRRSHRVASGIWGRLRVEVGSLRFVASTDPITDVTVESDRAQGIPPDVDHHIELRGSTRFAIEFWGRAS